MRRTGEREEVKDQAKAKRVTLQEPRQGRLSGKGGHNGEVRHNICIRSGNWAATGVFGKFVFIWINQRQKSFSFLEKSGFITRKIGSTRIAKERLL